jgi:hypothetical protein
MVTSQRLDVEIKMPKITKQQTHRDNQTSSTPEDLPLVIYLDQAADPGIE